MNTSSTRRATLFGLLDVLMEYGPQGPQTVEEVKAKLASRVKHLSAGDPVRLYADIEISNALGMPIIDALNVFTVADLISALIGLKAKADEKAGEDAEEARVKLAPANIDPGFSRPVDPANPKLS